MKRGNHHLQKPGPASKRSKVTSNLNKKKDDEIEYLKTSKNIIPELFSQWREFLDKDSFTDLRILCKNDSQGVSLHKAVVASCSSFLGHLLMDGRDESVLIIPDVEKRDLLNLVRILYGARTHTRPSQELLKLLGISKLPSTTVPLFTPTDHFTLTCIQAEQPSSDSEDDSSTEDPESAPTYGSETTPACSVGVSQSPVREGSEPREDDIPDLSESDLPDSDDNLNDDSGTKTQQPKKVVVKIPLNKLSPQLISQLRGSREPEQLEQSSPIRTRSRTRSQTRLQWQAKPQQTTTTAAEKKWIAGPAPTARGRPLVRRFSRVSSTSANSTASKASSRSSSRSSSSSSSGSSSSGRSSSNSSRSSNSSWSSVSSNHSGPRVWYPSEIVSGPPKTNGRREDTASEKSLTLALSESSDVEHDHQVQNNHEDANNESLETCSTSSTVQIEDNPISAEGTEATTHFIPATPRYNPTKIIEDDDEVFVNPTTGNPVTSTVTSKPNDMVLNTPAYVPATPKWCPDEGVCPPGRCKGTKDHSHHNHNSNPELTNMAMTSTPTTTTNTSLTRNTELQPTPFQTPPPSVTYSSSALTPEHCLTPANSSADPASPIQPPDLFKDDVNKPTKKATIPPPQPVKPNEFRTLEMDYIGVRSVLQVPPCNSQNWSDDEGDNENEKDNKKGDWSDCEQQWSEDEDGFPKLTTFQNLYQKTRAQMTPMTPRMTPRVMMTPRTTVATTNPAILPAMTPRSQLCVDFLDNIGFEFKL